MIHAQKLHNEFVRLGGARFKLKNKMLAMPETDAVMAENIVSMSKMAVQSLSKELRAGQGEKGAYNSADGSRQLVFGDGGFVHHAPLCKAVSITKKIELDENSTFLFMKLKNKLGKNLSDKEFLEILLEERAKQEFSQTASPKSVTAVAKQGTATISKETENDKSEPSAAEACKLQQKGGFAEGSSITGDTNEAKSAMANGNDTGRYIPADKKRQVVAKTHGKCTYPNCHAPFQVFHHVDRYCESKTHDSIIPLCNIHHEFAHHNLIRDEALTADKWRISVLKAPAEKISQADTLYRKYRREIRKKPCLFP